jgi:hypothetical protein
MTRIRRVQVSIALGLAVFLFAQSGEAQSADDAPRCGTGVHEGEATGVVLFPHDQIFCPLIADPKEPHSFASFLRGTFRSIGNPTGEDTNIGAVGLADHFGLVRWGGPIPGDGVQLDVVGSIFAQFGLDTPSNDLINADYIIGLPLTFRRSGFSARARLYHQSSHLGDEFLLSEEDITRENLSFEALAFLLSQEIGPLRVYGGAEHLFRREPDTLVERFLHFGAEFRTGRSGSVQMIGGVDVKATNQDDLSPAISARVGLQAAHSRAGGHPARLVGLLFEMYNGPSPYGQFFQDDISYVGVGLHFGL